MGYFTEVSFGILVAFLLILLLVSWANKTSYKPHLNLPPSPKPVPFIGHIHHLAKGKLLHRTFMDLSKRHGPLMFLKLGSASAVVVSSPEMAKEVLQTNGTIFASRAKLLSLNEVLYNGKSIGSAMYGQHWKDMRKLCTTELFTSQRVAASTAILKEELTRLIGGDILTAARNNHLVNVRKCVRELGFNTITRFMMSKAFFGSKAEEYGAEEAAEFIRCMDDIIRAILQISVGDIFPKLCWLDLLWTVPRLRKHHNRVDKFLQKMLVEHRMNGHTSGDFVDVLDLYFGAKNEDYTKATLMDLTLGGSDTSSTVVEWALAELLNHPEIMATAQEELETVVGVERLVTVNDIPKLEYLNAIIKETFRLHPPVSLDVRSNTCTVRVGGYDVPEKSLVLVNVFALGRDSDTWTDPEAFDPERFIGSGINVFGQDFELIPFGAGRRICPGLQLGLRNVQLTLANLLHGFNWSFPKGKTRHSMLEVFGIVSYIADPLTARVTPRLDEKIYRNVQMT